MATSKRVPAIPRVKTRARQVLRFAKERLRTAKDRIEMSNALFSPTGKATELFATEPERTAFCRTPEYKQVLKLLDTLPYPPTKGEVWFVETVVNGAK